MIKILLIPLVVILSACSTTNNKLEALKDPNCPWCMKTHRCKTKNCSNKKNDMKWATETINYWSVGKAKKA
jgi:hypothetical protein